MRAPRRTRTPGCDVSAHDGEQQPGQPRRQGAQLRQRHRAGQRRRRVDHVARAPAATASAASHPKGRPVSGPTTRAASGSPTTPRPATALAAAPTATASTSTRTSPTPTSSTTPRRATTAPGYLVYTGSDQRRAPRQRCALEHQHGRREEEQLVRRDHAGRQGQSAHGHRQHVDTTPRLARLPWRSSPASPARRSRQHPDVGGWPRRRRRPEDQPGGRAISSNSWSTTVQRVQWGTVYASVAAWTRRPAS